MKRIYLALFLNVVMFGFSQTNSDCEDFNLLSGSISYQLNINDTGDFISLSRQILSGYDDRRVIFETSVSECKNLKGIFLKLSNYEILAFENHNLKCEDLASGSYSLSGSLQLTNELYEKLLKYNIVEISLGDSRILAKIEHKAEFKRLLSCLNSAK